MEKEWGKEKNILLIIAEEVENMKVNIKNGGKNEYGKDNIKNILKIKKY